MNNNQRFTSLVTIVAALVIILPSIAFSQGMGGGGHGGGHGYMYFDPADITNLNGVITRVYGNEWQIWGNGNFTGGGMGAEFRSSDGQLYDLMLAPYWYLEQMGIELSVGDEISIRGSIVDAYYSGHGGPGMMHGMYPGTGDNDYIITVSLTLEGNTVELRNQNGYPLWRGNGFDGGHWFDPGNITTLKGTLSNNLGLWSCWGVGNYTGNGMHMLFNGNDDNTYYVMLAPWWYLEENGIVLSENTKATIKGSVVDPYWNGYSDYKYLIATELTINGVTVKLRDEYGYPLWFGGGWYYSSPTYQKKTVETVNGIVLKTRVRTHGSNLDPGYEAVLKIDGKRYNLYVAPRWFTDEIGFQLNKGDTIRVHGSLVENAKGRDDIVSRDIILNGKRIRFRNSQGSPMWVTGAK